MRINLEVHLSIEVSRSLGWSRSMQRGEFSVRHAENIPGAAYQWIKQIKKETGYRKTIIEKVTWNYEHDITDQVRQLDDAPIPDIDLPFNY